MLGDAVFLIADSVDALIETGTYGRFIDPLQARRLMQGSADRRRCCPANTSRS